MVVEGLTIARKRYEDKEAEKLLRRISPIGVHTLEYGSRITLHSFLANHYFNCNMYIVHDTINNVALVYCCTSNYIVNINFGVSSQNGNGNMYAVRNCSYKKFKEIVSGTAEDSEIIKSIIRSEELIYDRSEFPNPEDYKTVRDLRKSKEE